MRACYRKRSHDLKVNSSVENKIGYQPIAAEYRNQERYEENDDDGETWRGKKWQESRCQGFKEEVALGLNNLD